ARAFDVDVDAGLVGRRLDLHRERELTGAIDEAENGHRTADDERLDINARLDAHDATPAGGTNAVGDGAIRTAELVDLHLVRVRVAVAVPVAVIAVAATIAVRIADIETAAAAAGIVAVIGRAGVR